MEDALVLVYSLNSLKHYNHVLILVLMEDALVHEGWGLICASTVSLNPCFNGRCTRTGH